MLTVLMLLSASAVVTFSNVNAVAEGPQAITATRAMLDPAEEEVRFTSGANSLAGTLFWPSERTNGPAVVVLAGSDRSQRGALRIAIARDFAAHGVTALVYDSPGTGHSSGNALLQDSADRAAEATSAVDYLRSLPGIRPDAVGLFGGSEGANVALLACAGNPQIAFVIPVSGSLGVSILDILRYSAEKTALEHGLGAQEIAQAITFKEIAFVLLSGLEIVEWPLIESRVTPWQDAPWAQFIALARQRAAGLTEEGRQAFLVSFRETLARFTTQSWFPAVDVGNAVQRMMQLDAGTLFAVLESGRYSRDWERSLCFTGGEIRCPVLAIWGEEDTFLPPRQSAERLKKHLMDAQHSDFEIHVFPGASHFLTRPGSRSDFVPGYVDTMVQWIDQRFGTAANRSVPQR